MIGLFLAAALALSAPAAAPAAPQRPEAAPGLWTQADGRIAFATAHISLPLAAGAVRFQRSAEFSHAGEGIDSGLQYWSADEAVFATVYVYYPGLPHAGLTAFATDEAIHSQSGSALRMLGSRLAGAGGRDGAAIRNDYAGYRDGMASSAAFIKAGRWIVKLRVSGPEARRQEVEAAMTALLEGLRFDGEIQARPAALLEIGECQSRPDAPARLLAADAMRLLSDSLLANFDGAGEEPRDPHGRRLDPILARVGQRWCVSTHARIGNSSYSILRAAPGGPANGPFGRSVLLVPINDAGRTLELVEESDPRRFTLFHHDIGRTDILGSYDGPLSDEQIANILSGADREGTRIRASVQHLPAGGSNIDLPEAPAAESPPAPRS